MVTTGGSIVGVRSSGIVVYCARTLSGDFNSNLIKEINSEIKQMRTAGINPRLANIIKE